MLHQVRSYTEIAYSNTYNKQWTPKEAYEESIKNLTMHGGCYDSINQCRELAAASDPEYNSSNDTVNLVCELATANCALNVLGSYDTYTGV